MCLDDVKTTLGMHTLRCKSPAMVVKEALAYLTAHNLIRWLMVQAAREHKVDLELISFKGTVDAFRELSRIPHFIVWSRQHPADEAIVKSSAMHFFSQLFSASSLLFLGYPRNNRAMKSQPGSRVPNGTFFARDEHERCRAEANLLRVGRPCVNPCATIRMHQRRNPLRQKETPRVRSPRQCLMK